MIGKRKRPRVRKSAVRLGKSGMEELRWSVYFRDGGMCQLKLSPKCWGFANWEHGHLAHRVSRGAGGSDTEENTRWACRECHIGWEHNGGKPCPPKN